MIIREIAKIREMGIIKVNPRIATTFDGLNEVVTGDSGGAYNFERTDPWSFVIWARPEISNNVMPLVSKWFDETGFYIRTITAGGVTRLDIQLRTGTFTNGVGRGLRLISDVSAFLIGQVSCFGFSYDGLGVVSSLRAYVNGIEIPLPIISDSGVTAPFTMQNIAGLQIGATSNKGWYYKGMIDDVRGWDIALTPQQFYEEFRGRGIDPPIQPGNLILLNTMGDTATYNGVNLLYSDDSGTSSGFVSTGMDLTNIITE